MILINNSMSADFLINADENRRKPIKFDFLVQS